MRRFLILAALILCCCQTANGGACCATVSFCGAFVPGCLCSSGARPMCGLMEAP